MKSQPLFECDFDVPAGGEFLLCWVPRSLADSFKLRRPDPAQVCNPLFLFAGSAVQISTEDGTGPGEAQEAEN
jgi:hypothetical protein